MISVVHCGEISEAMLIRSVLQSEGIEAFVPDEFTAQNAPPYTWATGGIRVQVAEEDLERALAILGLVPAETTAS
jgi:hypothetical protein